MTTPPPDSQPIATPTTEETAAINQTTSDEEIRQLAQQLLKSGQLGFDPATILKGTVTAIDLNGSPPTLSVQISGDTTTTISGIRLLNTYSPQVGHVVLIIKQGPDIVTLGHIADSGARVVTGGSGGWNKATLAAGTHGGNSNGDVYYRRVLDHGSWKMQWRGAWSVSGSTMISPGGLDVEFRPGSRRTMSVPRNASQLNDVRVDFEPDGSVLLANTTTPTASAGTSGDVFWVDPIDNTDVRLSGYLSSAGSDLGHLHGVYGGHDHGFSGGSHTHTGSHPGWITLQGCEYFL